MQHLEHQWLGPDCRSPEPYQHQAAHRKAKTRSALHLDGGVRAGSASREREAVGLVAVGHRHTTDRVNSGWINDLVDPGLQGFSQRGANIGGSRHFDTTYAVHRNVEDIITVLCRQFEDIGQRLVRTGANRLCRSSSRPVPAENRKSFSSCQPQTASYHRYR